MLQAPRAFISLVCLFAAVAANGRALGAEDVVHTAPMMLDPSWLSAPRSEPASGFESGGVKAVFIQGPMWQSKQTRFFAWYGLPAISAGKKVPAMVLVHGGGGTAFADWVRLWTSRGYAAIAMDTCGQVPKGSYGHWERNPQGGPPGWDAAFGMIDQPIPEQWPYHAVADVVLAHSFIRSLREVDSENIGLTGISWGGYLTCIVSGLDARFRCAVPVYGCGFLGSNSVWMDAFAKMGPEKSARWLALWDPSVYLKSTTMPMLWVTGTNDFAYPMDSLQKSYRLPKPPHTLAIRIGMKHGHGGPGENPEEIHAFADHFLRGRKSPATIVRQGSDGPSAWVKFTSEIPIVKAELNFTRDAGPWQKRKWEAVAAEIKSETATAALPDGVKIYFFNLLDDRGLVVSSDHAIAPTPEEALAVYRAELQSCRKAHGGGHDLPDVKFFLFGMGPRAKLIYRGGALIDAGTGRELRRWKVSKEVILPPDYSVRLETVDGGKVMLREDERAVWLDEGGRHTALEMTESPVNLPDFKGKTYPRVLRVLHQEMLVNIEGSRPLPNRFVYDKPWYRDGAMVAMCLKETGNVGLLRDWIVGLREPFDKNNAGVTEPDNLGQALYLVSLVSDKTHPLVPVVLKEVARFEIKDDRGKFIKGRSDFAEHPVYQTKWMKFGLKALHLPDPYTIPEVADGYSALFWMDYRDRYVAGKDADDRGDYPYLGWACDHFHDTKTSPIANGDYPLSWEAKASQAHYDGMKIIDPELAKRKLATPHTWHAAEMFLLLNQETEH